MHTESRLPTGQYQVSSSEERTDASRTRSRPGNINGKHKRRTGQQLRLCMRDATKLCDEENIRGYMTVNLLYRCTIENIEGGKGL